MPDHNIVFFHFEKNILGPPTDRQNFLPGQRIAESGRHRKPELRLPHDDIAENCTLEYGREPAADGFDFRKFRHGNKVAV